MSVDGLVQTGLPLRVDVLLVLVLGGVAGTGLALLVLAWDRRRRPVGPAAPPAAQRPLTAALRGLGRRGAIAAAVGLLTLLVTRWPVAAVASAALVLAWPALFGGAGQERREAAKVEALAIWTESLRDTIAGAVGLEQAVVSTAQAAPAAIAPQLRELAERLRVRTPLQVALRRFADDLADPSADLIVAALILNSRLRGPGLRDVLTSLAESARSELDMRGRVAAGRASTRRSVQIVVGVTVTFVAGLAVFNREYVAPYASPSGQVVLLVVVLMFAGAFFWLRRLAAFDEPARLLVRGGQR